MPHPSDDRPGSRVPRPSDDRPGSRQPALAQGDAIAGGCMSLTLLLVEAVAGFVLALTLGLRGWSRSAADSKQHTGPPPMDWVPTLWVGAFALAIALAGVLFLRGGHLYAGSLHLLLGVIVLVFTLNVWHDEYAFSHPAPLPPCPTRAGVLCAPVDQR
ncbi:DUF6234 family protein [Streptomyces avermitilis]|uniref:DUF6234 family protein n=1 Tax=Streptomyces avermitilis TaxID=33903 RepID=UPI0033EE622A